MIEENILMRMRTSLDFVNESILEQIEDEIESNLAPIFTSRVRG